jgi:hypothetical protein
MVSSARFTRQVDAALKPVLAADDHLIASARVVSGSRRTVAAVNAALVVVGAVVGATVAPAAQLSTLWLSELLIAIGFLGPYCVTAWMLPPTFIAVTREQLICGGLKAFRRQTISPIALPLSAAMMTDYRAGRHTTSIAVNLPGRGPLQLHALGRRRQPDLENVLMWAHAAGVPIRAKPSRRRRSPLSLDYGTSLTGLPQWSNWPDD